MSYADLVEGGYYGYGTTLSGEPKTAPSAQTKAPLSFHDKYAHSLDAASRWKELFHGERSYWRTRERIDHRIYEDRASRLMIVTSCIVHNDLAKSSSSIAPSTATSPSNITLQATDPSRSEKQLFPDGGIPPTGSLLPIDKIIHRTIFLDLELLYHELEVKASGRPRDEVYVFNCLDYLSNNK